MHWIMLVVAGLLEVAWAAGMKVSEGFTRPWVSAATLAALVASFVLLAAAMRHLPLGTAYTVWTGIGAVGSVLVGILFLGESREPLRIFFVVLIVAGIVGLRMTTRE